ncbi:MAG: 3-hydroxyisobutyrate dehydrogenase [Gemmatimonadetes bacterium]|nr:3-hydroxyisobutyrate dehydrogenase [Gemmatimonadota bacterium]
MRVAFLGLGQMGSPMARRLVSAGHEVAVWNRSREKAREIEGARAEDTPADAVRGAEVVMTMLADDAAAQEVALGADGFAAAMAEGAVHASMSTISPALSRRLAEEHARRGQGYVAAPVFGRPEAAEGGKLRVLAAGPKEAVKRCLPLFDAVAQQTFDLGEDPPAANVVKLCGNFIIASMIETLGEVFALGRKSGVAPEALLDVLGTALLSGPILAGYAKTIAESRYEPAGFKLRLGLKDVRLVLATADAAEVPMPVASALHDRYLAGVAQGLGDLDWSGIARLAAESAGLDG